MHSKQQGSTRQCRNNFMLSSKRNLSNFSNVEHASPKKLHIHKFYSNLYCLTILKCTSGISSPQAILNNSFLYSCKKCYFNYTHTCIFFNKNRINGFRIFQNILNVKILEIFVMVQYYFKKKKKTGRCLEN